MTMMADSSFLLPHKIHLPHLNPHSNSINSTSIVSSSSEISEIRVCNNRSCRRQGSFQTLETLSRIAPPNVVVKSCGCLGRCGSGPNIVALPGPLMISHCGTPVRAAGLMLKLLGVGSELDEEARKCLEALALRKRAEVELSNGNCFEAESLYSQAIDLKPFGSLHRAYVGRSAARLRVGNFTGALADAEDALAIAPNYAEVKFFRLGMTAAAEILYSHFCSNLKLQAYICRGDAFMEMDQLKEVEKAYDMALEKDPSIRRSNSFKARISTLEEKLVSTSVQ